MNELQANGFDYSLVNDKLAYLLKEKESTLVGINQRYAKEVGKVFYDSQQAMSDYNNGGLFEKWYTALGFKKRRVYNYIQIYNEVQNLHGDELENFNSASTSLQIGASKPSANPIVKQKVLDGEITTHKQYKELEQKLKQAEAARQLSIQQHSIQQNKLIVQIDALKKSKTSDSPESLKRIKDLERQLLSNSNMLKKTEQELSAYRLRDTSEFDEEAARKQREKLQHEADIKTIDLRVAFKRFIENAAISSVLYGAIASASTAEKKHLTEMVEMAEKVIRDTKLALSGRKEIEQ